MNEDEDNRRDNDGNYTPRMHTVRPEIMEFARAMEAKMASHDGDRGDGWKDATKQFFFDRLADEYEECRDAEDDAELMGEAPDIANFAMMMWWTARQRCEPITPPSNAGLIMSLKIWPRWFRMVVDGVKTLEIRKADRPYQAGQLIELREWNPVVGVGYTGRRIRVRALSVIQGGQHGLQKEYVAVSIEVDDTAEQVRAMRESIISTTPTEVGNVGNYTDDLEGP